MTQEQLDRWKDFAFRMGRTCWPGMKAATRAQLVDLLEDFFGSYGHGQDLDKPPAWTDWDRNDGWHGRLCDVVWSFAYDAAPWRLPESLRDSWPQGNRLTCCIRAGIDMACASSGGVMGFTVGDLRRMYPEGLPDWLVTAIGPVHADRLITVADDGEGLWL